MSLETNDFILETSKYIRRRVRKNISVLKRKTQADEIRKKSLAKLKLQTIMGRFTPFSSGIEILPISFYYI